MESKKEIYDIIPQPYYPSTLIILAGTAFQQAKNLIEQKRIPFPLIAKPDIGMRGLQVKLLQNENDLKEYLMKSKVDFLLQEFIAYENEAGIFYYRIPGEKNGKISGIVRKEFLQITGDGVSTIEELIIQNNRYLLQLKVLQNNYGKALYKVPAKGEVLTLVPYGNHNRGAKFIDATYLVDEKLQQTIDAVCKSIPEFYYGRLDIKFNSWEELKQGKNFSIIELNGAGSEPTHIYDPSHSVFFAWKEIIRHLKILYIISMKNKFLYMHKYMSFSEGVAMLKANKKHVELISAA